MGNIFDTPTFRALFERLREQPRITAIKRVLDSENAAFATLAQQGYPVIVKTRLEPTNWGRAEQELRHALSGVPLQVRERAYDRPLAYAYERQCSAMTIGDYLGRLRSADSSLGYAANQPISTDVARELGAHPPKFVEQEELISPALWLGGAGAVTPLHKDSTDNFSIHLLGAKRWILFPVRDAAHLALRRSVKLASYEDFAPSLIDPREPDRLVAPSFDDAIAVSEIVRGGETLFVPAGWAHHVETLEPSLMVNYWVDGSRRAPFAMTPQSHAEFAVARLVSNSDCLEAFKLRYEVFTEERGDDRYADHERGVWMDGNDGREDAAVYGAIANTSLIGTLRLTTPRGGPFIGDAFYQWESLGELLRVPTDKVRAQACVFDRIAVARSHRGRGVMRSMVTASAEDAAKLGHRFILAAVESSNRGAQQAMRALGFTPYGDLCGDGWSGLHFLRDLHEDA